MLPDILVTDVVWHVPLSSAREWLDTLSEQDVSVVKTKLGFDADDSLDDVVEYLHICAHANPTLFNDVIGFELPHRIDGDITDRGVVGWLDGLDYPWGVASLKTEHIWSHDQELNVECEYCYDVGIGVETIIASVESGQCAPTTFTTMHEAVEYVRQTLGEFEDSFDVEGLADVVIGKTPVSGIYYIKYYGAEYWDVARDFERKVD